MQIKMETLRVLWHLEVNPVPAGVSGDVLGPVTAGEGSWGIVGPPVLFHK